MHERKRGNSYSLIGENFQNRNMKILMQKLEVFFRLISLTKLQLGLYFNQRFQFHSFSVNLIISCFTYVLLAISIAYAVTQYNMIKPIVQYDSKINNFEFYSDNFNIQLYIYKNNSNQEKFDCQNIYPVFAIQQFLAVNYLKINCQLFDKNTILMTLAQSQKLVLDFQNDFNKFFLDVHIQYTDQFYVKLLYLNQIIEVQSQDQSIQDVQSKLIDQGTFKKFQNFPSSIVISGFQLNQFSYYDKKDDDFFFKSIFYNGQQFINLNETSYILSQDSFRVTFRFDEYMTNHKVQKNSLIQSISLAGSFFITIAKIASIFILFLLNKLFLMEMAQLIQKKCGNQEKYQFNQLSYCQKIQFVFGQYKDEKFLQFIEEFQRRLSYLNIFFLYDKVAKIKQDNTNLQQQMLQLKNENILLNNIIQDLVSNHRIEVQSLEDRILMIEQKINRQYS